MAGVNRLPTKEEHEAFLRHREAAREFYRKGKFQEGWEYVLEHQEVFPREVLDKMFVEFANKIFNLKKDV